MKFTDHELEQAARQAIVAMGSASFSEEEQTFSPAFEERMTRLVKQQKRRKWLKRITCSVASVLLLLVIGGSLFLTFNLEARAMASAWYRSISAERHTYRFTEDRRGQPLPDYEATWLPEGYRYTKTTRFKNATHVGYRKESRNERYITPMGFEYFWISDQVTMLIHVGDYGGHTITEQQLTINGNPAYLYEDINRWNNTLDYDLVWIDQEAGLVFRLGTCRLSAEETIAVAESIRPVK